jgi:ATP-dependent DNA helicase DinG
MSQDAPLVQRSLDALDVLVASFGGEVRDGQRKMIAAVATAISENRRAVISAPVGSGKSFGYLIPALVAGKRVLVVTSGIALQDQIASKDLPLLKDRLGLPVTWQVLKGRSNLACVAKAAEVQAMVRAGGGVDPQVVDAAAWALADKSGDRNALVPAVSDDVWRQVSVGAEECPGASACPSSSRCHAELAKTKATVAQVVVTNMHLFGLHAGQGNILESEESRFDVVIIDEAHETQDVVAGVNGGEVNVVGVRALARAVDELWPKDPAVADLESVAARMKVVFAEIGAVSTVRLPAGAASDERLAEMFTHLDEVVGMVTARATAARQGASDGVVGKAGRVGRRAELLGKALKAALDPESAAGQVHWVSSFGYEYAPVSVAGMLVKNVWPGKAVIVTSGTMPSTVVDDLGLDSRYVAPEGDDIDAGSGPDDEGSTLDAGPAGRVVRDQEPILLRVQSPFDFKSNSLLYVAKHLPAPNAKTGGWEDAAIDVTSELVDASRGGALVLCTSMRMVDRFADRLDRDGWTVFAQGDGPKQQLVEAFAELHDSVLVATRSFWQGVDVPGSTCRLVIIDRIPMPRPDDPMVGARRDLVVERMMRGGVPRDAAQRQAFTRVDVPLAATALAQGAGRLIRSATDRGVVAVLDSRLATASYRSGLLIDVPLPRSVDLAGTKERLRVWAA